MFPYYAIAKPYFVYFTVHFFTLVLISAWILIAALKRNPPNRNQIQYVLLSLTTGYIGGASTFFLVYDVPLEPFAAHFIWLYAAVITYAIAKHKLMDINLVVRAGAIHLCVIALITVIYIIAVFLAGAVFQKYFNLNTWQQAIVPLTIIALVFKPLERRVQDTADRFVLGRTTAMIESQNVLLMQEISKQDHLRSVATLAAGMAHEIKNPLTTIKTFAEYLPDKFEDPAFRDNFKRIVSDEVERVNQIVKQLLNYSKPQAAALKMTSLDAVMKDTMQLVNSRLLAKRITSVASYGNATAWADPHQLRQVFLNIIMNAIEAMPHGGELRVETAAEGAVSRITISDTGVGLSKEDQKRIFDPFFSKRDGGTGLGLSVVYGIVREHGGQIEVKSEEGKGTSFSVFLKSCN